MLGGTVGAPGNVVKARFGGGNPGADYGVEVGVEWRRLDIPAAGRLHSGMSEQLLAAARARGVDLPPPPHTAAMLGEIATTMFLRPQRTGRKMPRELAYLAPADRCNLPTSAGPLAGWTWGPAGRPLVGLLHGWEGHGAQLGAFAAPLVAAGFRVLAIDAPGHGESPGDECSAGLIGRLVVELEPAVGRFHSFVAHSMGAAAAAMAATHGCAVRAMVFLAPPLCQLERVERVVRRLELPPAVGVEFAAAMARRTGLPLAESDMRHVARLAPCPLLAFHDPADAEASYADTAAFVSAWPGATLVPCPGRGHVRLLSTPEVVRRSVEFLQSFA